MKFPHPFASHPNRIRAAARRGGLPAVALAALGLVAPGLAGAAPVGMLHSPGGDYARAHTDTYMAYVSWDNAVWCAKLDGNRFTHAPNGGAGCDWSRSHDDTIINYKTWDGGDWTATVSGELFTHTNRAGGASHDARILNYQAAPGQNWQVALLTGGSEPATFVHAPGGDYGRSHQDYYTAYRAWDDSPWCARLWGDTFVHAPGCDWSRAQPGRIINYKTWGGGNWTASVDNGVFEHSPQNAPDQKHTDTILNYELGSGDNWQLKLLATPTPTPPPATACGNGKVEAGEECDGAVGCSATCQWVKPWSIDPGNRGLGKFVKHFESSTTYTQVSDGDLSTFTPPYFNRGANLFDAEMKMDDLASNECIAQVDVFVSNVPPTAELYLDINNRNWFNMPKKMGKNLENNKFSWECPKGHFCRKLYYHPRYIRAHTSGISTHVPRLHEIAVYTSTDCDPSW